MSFDDEDPTPEALLESPAKAHDDSDSEGDDDKIADYRLFASSIQGRKGASQAAHGAIRRGEKDFESHDTRAQEGALEASRSAMHDVLSYTRQQHSKTFARGWYFPDQWAHLPRDETSYTYCSNKDEKDSKYPLFSRDRVVVVEATKGNILKLAGRVVKTDKPCAGSQNTWLLPEEALLLVERGSLDLWWPVRAIEDVLPMNESAKGEASRNELFEDHELGVPLSLQAAYALLIGRDTERGKTSLERYQVYAQLSRTSFKVMRAFPLRPPPILPKGSSQNLWQWLLTFLQRPSVPSVRDHFPKFGPLLKPGLYRSYIPIFEQVALIKRHKPTLQLPSTHTEPSDPFKVHFHLWKITDGQGFSKTRPPPPDFRLCVVDARDTTVPSLEELDSLLLSTPYDPPRAEDQEKKGAGFVYKRLKHGWRNVILGIVDRGIISYMTFGEIAFGEERLYEDSKLRPRGKKGGRGGQRGVRRGRGRGRGRGG
ncbi:tRNA-splicing endonuclease subunit sen54 N-term-domain-containing protein [Xylariaceae sp. FL0255]|nr:tRNA-splicing endonuclease subunit sen54 N-term-domain-containing protein [Xylariaceae sp. FL0255]